MKVPLEPIPTDQLEISHEEVISPRAQIAGVKSSAPIGRQSQLSSLHKAYPWLLATSVCLSALLCWMYVTKPVLASEPIISNERQIANDAVENELPVDDSEPVASEYLSKPDLLPSDDALPGEKPNTNGCLLYTSPSPRDQRGSRMPSSA